MKIAILSSRYGINVRGVETWIDSLKSQLQDKFDIQVFKSVTNLRDWIKSDIIVPIDGRFQVFVTRILTWMAGKSMVVFGHSGPGADDKWNLLCSPNVFVAFSTYQKEWAEKFKLPWTKIEMIPHAVDTKRFTPASKKPNNKIILCNAANTPSKRVGLVREAVNLIPGAKFIAVGKDSDLELPFSEIPEIYKKADVFCFTPQSWEAFGLVFLEALATNLPVVTINDPVRREIVGEAGIFVDHPENSEELAEVIKQALSKDWKDRPRRQAERFAWGEIKVKYKNLFNNLI